MGANLDDEEAPHPYIESLVVREFSQMSSNWRSAETAQLYLNRHKIPVIWDIDTRALVRHIRKSGSLRGVVATDGTAAGTIDSRSQKFAQDGRARNWPAASVARKPTPGTKAPSSWPRLPGRSRPASSATSHEGRRYRVAAYDYGIKQNILRMLIDHHCEVLVIPAQTPAEDVLGLGPDGIFLSNGPGDPEPVDYAVENIRKLMGKVPVFGICLGHQLCGLALGGKTFKLKFGHHGSNHPVHNLLTQKVEITAQNHGFCVDPESLPSSDVEITHVNLNDQTNEGMRHKSLPLFSVQYHPEASPGPHDSHYLFTQFTEMMKETRAEFVWSAQVRSSRSL